MVEHMQATQVAELARVEKKKPSHSARMGQIPPLPGALVQFCIGENLKIWAPNLRCILERPGAGPACN